MQLFKQMLPLAALLVCANVTAAEPREIAVQMKVPDATWSIVIDEVQQLKAELWVFATLSANTDMMGAQMISTVSDAVTVTAPDLPSKYFVSGKTWNWDNEAPYQFIDGRGALEDALKSAKLLYKRDVTAAEQQ